MQKTIKLNNGIEMPTIGLVLINQNQIKVAVKYAIPEAGYRHIDGASVYHNEQRLARCIKVFKQSNAKMFYKQALEHGSQTVM